MKWLHLKDLGKFEGKIEDTKNIRVFKKMSRYGINNVKKAISMHKCPFKKLRGKRGKGENGR